VTALADAEVTDRSSPGPEAPPRRRWLPNRATWPLWIMTAGMPVMFLVGFHGLCFPLAAVVLGARILKHPKTIFPWACLPLFLFVVWATLSITVVPPHSWLMWLYRWLLFAGTLAVMVWVANVDRKTLPTQQVVDWMAWLWITTIAFGYVSQLLPDFTTPSLTTLAFGPAGKIDFIARITQWQMADDQHFMALHYIRPAAPWAATNSWGAAIGMLTPFFIQSWLMGVDRRRRQIGLLLLLAGAFPILVSANRGMWIALVVGFVYFTARRTMRGKYSALIVLLIATACVGAAMVATPAGKMVADRIEGSGDSDATRSHLYKDAWDGAKASPLIGNGHPKDTTYYKTSPPVGTHGLLWYLMFINGFPGLFLFLGWLAVEIVVSGRVRTALSWAPHLCIVITLIEVPYYGLQPHVMLTGIAAGLVARETVQRGRAEPGDEPEASAPVTPAAAPA
jgi:hypothetical protein